MRPNREAAEAMRSVPEKGQAEDCRPGGYARVPRIPGPIAATGQVARSTAPIGPGTGPDR